MEEEPIVESIVEPVVEPIIEPVVEPVIELVIEPVVESIVEPVVEPVIESIVEPTPIVVNGDETPLVEINKALLNQIILRNDIAVLSSMGLLDGKYLIKY